MLSGFKEFLMRGNVVDSQWPSLSVPRSPLSSPLSLTRLSTRWLRPELPEFGLGFHIREGNPAPSSTSVP